jgi:hypothetical protein
MPSFNPYLTRDYPGSIDAPFRVAETMGPVPRGHDYLDNLRMYWRRTPEAQYPDGYLGTVPSRRGDRLLDGLKARQTNRPYTRGIHKGERIDTRDYEWPPEFNLWTGLEMEAAGVRFFPPGLVTQEGILEGERYPTDRKVGPRSVPVGSRYPGVQVPNAPDRRPVLAGQAPPYASGIRGNPGMAVPYPGR